MVFSSSAKLMWDELAVTYYKIDGSVIFNLHYKINTVSQNGSKLSDYYHKLNSLWREYDAMVALPVCACDGASSYKDHAQLLKLMQLGLLSKFVDNKKRCFELIGYPPNFKKRNNSGQNSLTMQVFLIQHMTFTTTFLFNIIDVSHLDITVAHPNGTKAKVNQVGSCKLNDNLIIHDVLVVPGYHDSVLKSQVGTGSEKDGLYFLNLVLCVLKNDIDLKGDFTSEPCDVCHRAKQTREPFPLSDHKSNMGCVGLSAKREG
ncbi:hypothetical protein Tco_1366349 [Tanacetum coccineum]